MKVAVLVYGQYRDFDISVTTWDFINHLDCDFYFSTWNKSSQTSEKLNLTYSFDVNEDMIRKFISNSQISILDESIILDTGIALEENTRKIIYHWKNGLKMIRESNVDYDMIFLLRFDTIFTISCEYNEILKLNEDKTLYYDGRGDVENKTVSDLFFISKFEVLSEFIDKLNDNAANIHTEISNTISILNLNLKSVIDKLDFQIIRPTVRELIPNNFNLKNIWAKNCEWHKGKLL
jgi:hypothetical protein